MDAEDILGLFIVLGLIFIVILIPTNQAERIKNLEKEAVKSGAAYYKVNNEDGKTEFTWKHLEKAEK